MKPLPPVRSTRVMASAVEGCYVRGWDLEEDRRQKDLIIRKGGIQTLFVASHATSMSNHENIKFQIHDLQAQRDPGSGQTKENIMALPNWASLEWRLVSPRSFGPPLESQRSFPPAPLAHRPTELRAWTVYLRDSSYALLNNDTNSSNDGITINNSLFFFNGQKLIPQINLSPFVNLYPL